MSDLDELEFNAFRVNDPVKDRRVGSARKNLRKAHEKFNAKPLWKRQLDRRRKSNGTPRPA